MDRETHLTIEPGERRALARHASSRGQSSAEQTRSRLRAKIDRRVVRLTSRVNQLQDLAADARDRAREVMSVEHHVTERPVTVFAVAAAAGYLLGSLLD